jgi:multiple sugar transport system ATP-binding protein
MAEIRIDGLGKDFGAIAVLRGIDLHIRDGEFVVLVGPSGCGKSTLLRLIAGLEPISRGEIRIGDRLVNDLAPKDRDVAMVFQSYALYPHMTVRENMSFSLKLQGLPKAHIHVAVQSAAEKLEIQGLLERKPRELSGGQRQRVAMGRAMVREPKAFLFDEPLSNLDARLREQMRYEIRRLQRELGTTSIYVTHDQIEAMTMADRIVAMHDGIAQQIGTPAQLYDDPANLFVAGFIGSPAMNFLRAELVEDLDAGDSAAGLVSVLVGREVLSKIRRPQTLPTDRRVTVGIRPERVALRSASAQRALPIDLLEPTGLGTVVHLKLADQRLKAFSTERLPMTANDTVGIFIRPEDLLLFDPASGVRVR